MKSTQKSAFWLLAEVLVMHKEYRNLLDMRLRKANFFSRLLLRVLFPLMDTLNIWCEDIGKCLFIQHGFATWISAESIGEYCWINQQVTIGYTFSDKKPVIGNGVRISAGAKVLGDITVGDNAIIAANAAVVKNVESCDVVGGVPARKIGVNIEHKLFVK